MSRTIALRITDTDYIRLKTAAAEQRNTIPQYILLKALGPVHIVLTPAEKDKLNGVYDTNTKRNVSTSKPATPVSLNPNYGSDPDAIDFED